MFRDNSSKFSRAGAFSSRRIAEQTIILAAVAALVYWLAATTSANLNARGITTGFGFLSKPANMAISESFIAYSPSIDTYTRVLLIGAINTMFVSFISIFIATVIGVSVGLARLSPNWLLNRSAAAYVEAIRNVPLPLQLLLWYQILLSLPTPREATVILDAVVLTNRGLWMPNILWQLGHFLLAAGAVLLVAVIIMVKRRQGPRTPKHGLSLTSYLWLVLLALLIAAMIMRPEVDTPLLRGFNFQGGVRLSPELAALVLGLALYSGAFIGEIIRAGILSVPIGQWEAGRALGLSQPQIVRKIVLPLSLRFAIPPTANEYLNIVKNSSLAVVIGYPELTALSNTMLSDTGQPIEAIAILMLAYLSISAVVSGFMNWYERHTALVIQ